VQIDPALAGSPSRQNKFKSPNRTINVLMDLTAHCTDPTAQSRADSTAHCTNEADSVEKAAKMSRLCGWGRSAKRSKTPITVGLARSLTAERILSNVDLVGLIVSLLLDNDGTRARWRGGLSGRLASMFFTGDHRLLVATQAAHGLCLTSKAVRAAVLASVQRMRMDRPLPAVLQKMASLVSLHVGPGPWTPLSCGSSPTCASMGTSDSRRSRLSRPLCSSLVCRSCGWRSTPTTWHM
jgi:hypothetical protein